MLNTPPGKCFLAHKELEPVDVEKEVRREFPEDSFSLQPVDVDGNASSPAVVDDHVEILTGL
ncbi:ORF08 [Psittacine aviadenovirus B]|uniref:ORF08 n=1 Tax=psittacine adenovirus 4 TaxID=2773287 RepID=A0A1P8SW59_9ADEN|nr:ORF08 [Psittacine aviadenovirus B]APY28341.1 ORF08 [psittacine adenovirus 4]